jgi:hypothetical protein
MGAIVERLIEIGRVFVLACVADDVVRLAVVLTIGVLAGLVRLGMCLGADGSGSLPAVVLRQLGRGLARAFVQRGAHPLTAGAAYCARYEARLVALVLELRRVSSARVER